MGSQIECKSEDPLHSKPIENTEVKIVIDSGTLKAEVAEDVKDQRNVDKENVDNVDAGNKSTGTQESAPDMKENVAAAVSDLVKKQRRAERFGVELQVSEDEKRKSRGSRFQNNASRRSSIQMQVPCTEEEAEKRKARALRFGMGDVNAALSSDEAAKKKARLTRFGSDKADKEISQPNGMQNSPNRNTIAEVLDGDKGQKMDTEEVQTVASV